MNKLVTGAIAGAAGIALLLGGAGTFALWNSSASVGSGTIVAGNLVVGAPTTSGWSVAHLGANGVYGTAVALTALTGFKASPGDKLTYSATVPITATGDNLAATLSLAPGSITPTDPAASNDAALATFLSTNAVVSMSGTGISGTAPAYVLTAGSAGISTTASVTATVTFSSGVASTENTAMLGSVSLSAMKLTLTQN